MKINHDWLNRFAEQYGFILLYCFIASLLINPFLLLLAPPGTGQQTITSANTAYVTGPIVNLSFQPLPGIKSVTSQEKASQDAWATQVDWTGLTAIIGWMVTSDRFKRGLSQLYAKIFPSTSKNKEQAKE